MSSQTSPTEVLVRSCHGLREFEECVALQRSVWGGSDLDVVPLPLFVVAAETGGQVLGAFAEEPEQPGRPTLVGFTLAVAGARDAGPFLHSHMTAVLEGYRNRGIGRQLKLFQRQDALARGIGLVEWTFDPLELRNAYFNFMRLGTIARRFLPNCYGITSSPLHRGLPTDRLVAEWWLASPRVKNVLEGPAGGSPQVSVEGASSAKRIHVPSGFTELLEKDPAQARAVHQRIGKEFQQWLGCGYAVVSIEVSERGGEYILQPWPQHGDSSGPSGDAARSVRRS